MTSVLLDLALCSVSGLFVCLHYVCFGLIGIRLLTIDYVSGFVDFVVPCCLIVLLFA